MESKKKEDNQEKSEYLFKLIYLIRINLPTNELLYIIMFFFKYLGFILFSISLNELKINNNNNDSEISYNFFYQLLLKFIINGSNLKILIYHYQEICLIGFYILVIYILFIVFAIYFMKKKYYIDSSSIPIDLEINKRYFKFKFEKYLFKIIAYFFFLIVFFHQYIIEYYIFGFCGYILNYFGLLNSKIFDFTNTKYYLYIEEHINSISHNEIKIIIFNGVMIIVVFSFFVVFMGINPTNTLFINIGLPFYGNKKYLTIKIFIFNFNFLYSTINMLNFKVRAVFTFIVIIIILFIVIIDIYLSFYYFSFYPSNLANMCMFIEFFSFFAIFTEIILFLSNFRMNSFKYSFSKFFFEIFNSFLFTCIFINKKNEYIKKLLITNLFSKAFNILNPNDIYFFINELIYNKNNYIKKFILIQNHILLCNKNDCICHTIISKFMSYSLTTSCIENKNNDSENEKIFQSNKNINKILDDANKKQICELKTYQNNDASISQSNINLINNYINKNRNIFNKLTEDRINKRSSTITKNIENKNNKIRQSLKIINNKFFSNLTTKKNEIFNNIESKNIKVEFDLKKNENIQKNNKEIIFNDKKRKLKEEQFQIIGEQEIINRINFLYNSKNFELLKTYIFIHLQYLIKIKNNFRLALYFTGKYSNCGIKFNFLELYYFYEIKKYIIRNIFKKAKNIKDSFITNFKEENANLKNIIKYIFFYQMVKRLLKLACEKIICFHKFRRELHNPLILRQYIKTKIYPVINFSLDIQTSIKKLKFIIKKYNEDEKNSIKSIELCYLITNFFKLVDGKLSPVLLQNISPLLHLRRSHYVKILNDFHSFMMNDPLIISLTKKDTFNIMFFTNNILNKLNYTYLDLKNKDFHEKLFPGNSKFIKEHSLIMKQFLFFNNNYYKKNESFIKSKEGYLVPINFECKMLPNLNHDFYLIVNIIFNDDKVSKNNQNSNEYKRKNLNKIYNNLIKTYSFLLGSDFEFYGLSKNFYLDYYLNQNVFRKLKLNFCQFFCVDEKQLIKHIKKEKKILKEYNNIKKKIPLKELNKAYTIFQDIEIKNIFKLTDEKILTNYFYPPIYIYDKIDKNKLIKNIPSIIKLINELGLNYEYYITIEDFKQRLINDNFQYKKSDLSKKIDEKQINLLKGEIKKSSILNSNNPYNLELIFRKKSQCFEVEYVIRKISSLKYYIVNLYEIFNNNLGSTKINPKLKFSSCEKLNTLFNNYDIKNTNSKHSLILNKLSSKSSDMLEIQNTEKKIHSFILSNKNNIAYVNSELRKVNTNSQKIILNNINKFDKLSEKKLNKKKEIIEDNVAENNMQGNIKSKKTQKITLNNIIKINKSKKIFNSFIDFNSNKKLDINNKNNEINNKIEYLKNNSEYLKKISLKQEYSDDDEFEKLITKDKFNEIIRKFNIRNAILIFILFGMMILSLIFIYCRYLICTSDSAQSNYIFTSAIILEMLRIDIYQYTLLSLFYCIDVNISLMGISNIQSNSEIKFHEILEHVKLLQDKINIIINNDLHVSFYDIIKQRFLVNVLNNDWTISQKNVDLMEEIRRIAVLTYDLRVKNDSCNNVTFYKYLNKGSDIFKNGEVNEAKGIEKIFFYFFSNIFVNFKDIFNKLTEEAIKILIFLGYIFLIKLLYYVIGILIISIIFIIIDIIKFYYDYSYYQILFLYYFIITNEQLEFEKQIHYYYKVIHDFDYYSISYFEYIKNNSNLIDNIEDFSEKSNNLNTSSKNYLSNSKKSDIRESFSNKKESNKNINFNKKILSEDLNESLNGSSLLFLNNNKTDNISADNKNNNNSFVLDEKKNKICIKKIPFLLS